jgi:hypothetical protein
MVAWQDPNFGIRFKDNMEVIDSVGTRNRFRFLAGKQLVYSRRRSYEGDEKTQL